MVVSIFKITSLYGVVHLDGKHASVKIAGAPPIASAGIIPVFTPNGITQGYESVPDGIISEDEITAVLEYNRVQQSVTHLEQAQAEALIQAQAQAKALVQAQEQAQEQAAAHAASKKRIEQLENLIHNLTSSVDQAEQAREEGHAELFKLEEENRKALQAIAPLEGFVHVVGKELNQIRFGEKAVTLSLEGDARVICAQAPLVLHSNSTIIVRGKGNELVVPTSLVCEGEIVFAEENAELTISLAPHAKLMMQQESGALTLSPDAVFVCKGAGSLIFTSNCGLAFDRKPSGARIVLTDGLQVTMTGNMLSCGGIGSLVLDKGASLDLSADQQCVIGEQSEDYINLIVRDGAGINMTSFSTGGLIFHTGAYDLNVIEKGFINVGQGASLCLQNPRAQGAAVCKSLTVIRGGRIRVMPNGLFVAMEQQAACSVNLEERAIEAGGNISYQGLNVQARIQHHGAFKRRCSLGALVRTLINKKSSFNWATLFEDSNKQSWIFLPERGATRQLEQGNFVKLNGNEIVTSENVEARKVCGVAQGNCMEVSSSGVLFNIPRTRAIFLRSQEDGLASMRSFFTDRKRSS